jgi:hypothetical protein
MNFVAPIYPREARLAHTEGAVKLILVFADDGSVADLQTVSGDPLLLASTIKAVHQWHISMAREVGNPREAEIPLSFTFKIEDPPEPVYLHLRNGNVIRANTVREFTDRVEYTVGHRSHHHHISPDLVTDVSRCARASIRIPPREGDCIPPTALILTSTPFPCYPPTSKPATLVALPRIDSFSYAFLVLVECVRFWLVLSKMQKNSQVSNCDALPINHTLGMGRLGTND